jgi:ABC-type Na+ transport system ATPase subunit NatA
VENADRVVLIAAGQIVRVGTPAELMTAAGASDLTEAYIALTSPLIGHPLQEPVAP